MLYASSESYCANIRVILLQISVHADTAQLELPLVARDAAACPKAADAKKHQKSFYRLTGGFAGSRS